MTSLTFPQVKQFMEQLLLSTAFDRFLLSTAVITTGITFTIDGQFHPEFYEEDSDVTCRSENGLVFWSQIRPVCLSLIRGKHTPLSFHFVLCLSRQDTERLLSDTTSAFRPEDIRSLILNIHYQDGRLFCTTASSMNFFTLDRSLDEAWGKAIVKFFLSLNLIFDY